MTEKMCRMRVFFIVIGTLLLSELGIQAQMSGINPEIGILLDNTIACQGKLLKLKCQNSSMTLKIYSAMYGRTEPGDEICPYRGWNEHKEFHCGESDVTTRLQRICGRRTKCRILVGRAVFGNLCPGKDLYLTVIYSCESRKPKKNTSTAPPNQLTTTWSLDTSTLAKSTQRTPTSEVVNITTAAVATENGAVNSTEKPYTNEVEIISKDNAVFTSSSSAKPVFVNTTQPPGHLKTPAKSEPSVTPPAAKVQYSKRGSVRIWSKIIVCLLILQEHSTSLILVFFAGMAGAMLVSAIAAVFVIRRFNARRNDQRLKVIEVPKLNTSPKPSPALETKTIMATRVMVPSPEPSVIHTGNLPCNPPQGFYTEYLRPGHKEPTSPRNVVPGMVVMAPSSKEIYRKDLNTDRIRCVHTRNDASPEVYPVQIQDGLRMYPNPMYADHIPPGNEPHSQATS